MLDEPDPPRKFYKLKEAEFERVNPEKITPDANDVHAVLRENLDRANAAGLNELAPKPKRRSKRRRDYWTLLFLGNGFFGTALALAGLKNMVGICALSGIVLFTTALTWIMWVLMDDY